MATLFDYYMAARATTGPQGYSGSNRADTSSVNGWTAVKVDAFKATSADFAAQAYTDGQGNFRVSIRPSQTVGDWTSTNASIDFSACTVARAFCLTLLAGVLAACDIRKPNYPREQGVPLTVSISSDGQLLAVLDRDSKSEQRLRIKWLNKDEPWQALPLPMYTSNIHFALQGYDLLLSHALPDNTDVGQITRWNVADLAQPSQTIGQGPFYAFPIEVKPGSYLVRACETMESKNPNLPNRNVCQSSGLGSYWVLLAPGAEPVRLTPTTIQPVYPQPNVTDQGFFWTSDYVVGRGPYSRENQPTTHPMLLTFPLPGGDAPQVAVEHLSPESDLVCDRTVERCLRQYRRGEDPVTMKFIYDTEVLYRGQRCPIEGVQGYADFAVITPDGRAAAIPVARVSSEPRRLVVVKFQDGQCAPTSIQTQTFEEK